MSPNILVLEYPCGHTVSYEFKDSARIRGARYNGKRPYYATLIANENFQDNIEILKKFIFRDLSYVLSIGHIHTRVTLKPAAFHKAIFTKGN